jgi:hypothetical protein
VNCIKGTSAFSISPVVGFGLLRDLMSSYETLLSCIVTPPPPLLAREWRRVKEWRGEELKRLSQGSQVKRMRCRRWPGGGEGSIVELFKGRLAVSSASGGEFLLGGE